ncbi:Lrp/AsnC family transcriptional regulator [Acinetobacter baumannii]|nr:Lrp/AsnC family transcriptional regulator [Acinetobacter baumannii]
MKLDRIDIRLLDEIQSNNRLSSEELGDRVGLSSTGVQRRLKRLRAEGIIKDDVSIVSNKAVGYDFMAIVLVTLEHDRSDIIDQLKQSIRSTPEIMNGFFVTGDADFALTIVSKNIETYEKFTQEYFYKNKHIKSFKTMVIMDQVKMGFKVPLPYDNFDF